MDNFRGLNYYIIFFCIFTSAIIKALLKGGPEPEALAWSETRDLAKRALVLTFILLNHTLLVTLLLRLSELKIKTPSNVLMDARWSKLGQDYKIAL